MLRGAEDDERRESGTKLRAEHTRSPQHRKTNRRLRSPPLYDPGGLHTTDVEAGPVPNTRDLAQSFLQDEALAEKRELEAIYMSQSRSLDESIISERSEGSATGTGEGLGLPGFLAGFLQGILDRFEARIQHLAASIQVNIPSGELASSNIDDELSVLKVNIANIGIDGLSQSSATSGRAETLGSITESPSSSGISGQRRKVSIRGIALSLAGQATRSAKKSNEYHAEATMARSPTTSDPYKSDRTLPQSPMPRSTFASTSRSSSAHSASRVPELSTAEEELSLIHI